MNKGPDWDILSEGDVLCLSIVTDNSVVNEEGELAVYPPITGG